MSIVTDQGTLRQRDAPYTHDIDMCTRADTRARSSSKGGVDHDHRPPAPGRDPEPVSVVLPTYEEAQTIRQAISGVRAALSREHEIIVVDDSPDEATAAAVRDGYGGDEHVQLVERGGDGLASAVLAGFDRADYPLLAVMDADLQHPPRSLPVVLSGLDAGGDVVVGSRHAPGGEVAAEWPVHRQLISWGATRLARVMVPQARNTTDPMSGFFAVRAAYVEAVREELRPEGYKVLLELLARTPVEDIRERGYTFREREAGGSNLGVREYLRFVRHLGRLAIPARRERLVDPVERPQEADTDS